MAACLLPVHAAGASEWSGTQLAADDEEDEEADVTSLSLLRACTS